VINSQNHKYKKLLSNPYKELVEESISGNGLLRNIDIDHFA
jgi:hypothetical protein